MSFHPFQALEHGGPDALGVPRWDFSANANACGVAPHAWTLIAEADRAHYPDPTYADLRAALGAQHGVAPERIVLAASGSEFIRRISVAVALGRPDDACVRVPAQAYAEYAAAARALGLRCDTQAAGALPLLAWWASPDSPTGVAVEVPRDPVATHGVVDLAYAPLQLEGAPCEPPAWTWQLWSPNKALGLTGVRGAYAVAPEAAMRRGHPDALLLERLQMLAPSWPLGAEGVALLSAWARPETGAWLVHTRATLRAWKTRQVAMLEALGWAIEAGAANFMLAQWRLEGEGAEPLRQDILVALRDEGVKLRDTTSLGRPGQLRLSVQPPAAQDALAEAWLRVRLLLAQRAEDQASQTSSRTLPEESAAEASAPAAESASPQSELPFEPVPPASVDTVPDAAVRADASVDTRVAEEPTKPKARTSRSSGGRSRGPRTRPEAPAGALPTEDDAEHALRTATAEAAVSPEPVQAEDHAAQPAKPRRPRSPKAQTPRADRATDGAQPDAPQATEAESESATPPATDHTADKENEATARRPAPRGRRAPRADAKTTESLPTASSDAEPPSAPASPERTGGKFEGASDTDAPARKTPRRRRKPAAVDG